jgi:hypothetical protein
MFINNKYLKWYNNIIGNAKNRESSAITVIERHHIVPKSLGGTNKIENLVILTPREHFICHWLLTKITTGKEKGKMLFALISMRRENKYQTRYNTKITSKVFERIKLELAESYQTYFPSSKKGLTYEEMYGEDRAKDCKQKIKDKRALQLFTPERNQKISISNTGKLKGIPKSSEHKKSLSLSHLGHLPSMETREKMAEAKVGKQQYIIVCPHCGKSGGNTMRRWHFTNCREKS